MNAEPPVPAEGPTGDAAPQAGKLQVTVTYLEMASPPEGPAPDAPEPGLTIVQAHRPEVHFYRYLYNTVGAPWLWVDRRKLSDEALRPIIQDPRVQVYVLYARGVPAGYAELDLRGFPAVEVAYFGLMPERIGRGLGPYLLGWAIRRAWEQGAGRLWLHTCTLDHPKALSVYQRAGFVAYDRKVTAIDDPRASGLL